MPLDHFAVFVHQEGGFFMADGAAVCIQAGLLPKPLEFEGIKLWII